MKTRENQLEELLQSFFTSSDELIRFVAQFSSTAHLVSELSPRSLTQTVHDFVNLLNTRRLINSELFHALLNARPTARPEIAKVARLWNVVLEVEVRAGENAIRTKITMPITESILALCFGTIFIVVLIVIAIKLPTWTPEQALVFRVVLALSAAGVGVIIPGLFHLKAQWANVGVRAGGAMGLFAVTFFVTPESPTAVRQPTAIIGEPTSSNEEEAAAPGCYSLDVARIENDLFLYTEDPWPFPTSPEGEDASGAFNPLSQRRGLVTNYPLTAVENSFAHISIHHLTSDLTFSNRCGEPILIEGMSATILNRYPLPASARSNLYNPLIEPATYQLELSPGKQSYDLTRGDMFSVAAGQTEAFRIKVLAPNDLENYIYRLRVDMSIKIGSGRISLAADRTLMIASLSEVDRKAGVGNDSNKSNQIGGASKRDLTPPELQIAPELERAKVNQLALGLFPFEKSARIRSLGDCELLLCSQQFPEALECLVDLIEILAQYRKADLVVVNEKVPDGLKLEALQMYTSGLAAYLGNIKLGQKILVDAAEICKCDEAIAVSKALPDISREIRENPNASLLLIQKFAEVLPSKGCGSSNKSTGADSR